MTHRGNAAPRPLTPDPSPACGRGETRFRPLYRRASAIGPCAGCLGAASGRGGRAAAGRARMVRSLAEQAACPARPAPPARRGHCRRHQYRKVGDLQPSRRRSGQRLQPLAAGTKHPVCLAPPELADAALLERLFEPFTLSAVAVAARSARWIPRKTACSGESARPCRRGCYSWTRRTSTPTSPVNWQRARAIRQAADVLVAVLTQQKYNDAAVKQFFRAAVEARKADRRGLQPVRTGRRSRVLAPLAGHVLPAHRRTGRNWCTWFPTTARPPSSCGCPSTPWKRSWKPPTVPPPTLRCERPISATIWPSCVSMPSRSRLSAGRCGQVLDPRHGSAGLLGIDPTAAGEFSAAASALSATELARVGWPSLPASVLVEEIRRWWDEGRQPWSRQHPRLLSNRRPRRRPGPSAPPGTPWPGRR